MSDDEPTIDSLEALREWRKRWTGEISGGIDGMSRRGGISLGAYTRIQDEAAALRTENARLRLALERARRYLEFPPPGRAGDRQRQARKLRRRALADVLRVIDEAQR